MWEGLVLLAVVGGVELLARIVEELWRRLG